jgi:hypothetical protein
MFEIFLLLVMFLVGLGIPCFIMVDLFFDLNLRNKIFDWIDGVKK